MIIYKKRCRDFPRYDKQINIGNRIYFENQWIKSENDYECNHNADDLSERDKLKKEIYFLNFNFGIRKYIKDSGAWYIPMFLEFTLFGLCCIFFLTIEESYNFRG